MDATLGGAGHARLLLEARPDLRLLGIDQDAEALAAAAEVLAPFGDRVTLRHGRFDRLEAIMSDLEIESASGVLFDLGVSSPQLDVADRGFSYRYDGPLDMRMDRGQTWAAADVVNGYREVELARILREYGDERFADRIARAIVANRPIESTAELAVIVQGGHPGAGPSPRRPSGQAHVPGHPHRGEPRAGDPARRPRRRHRAHGAGRSGRRARRTTRARTAS